ncbi:MAG: AAA family ATPase [Fimbriimonadales bacterium]
MRLIALELHNFRQYAHARLEFASGITAIVGPNGAGKTTLLEAVLWALYGARALREGTGTLRFLWSQGGAKVRVDLEFELGNRRYRVRRTPSDADLAQRKPDGTWSRLAHGTNAVNRQVERLLGMNHLQFQTSFCARQKELEFLGYTPQRRREEISKMLGYERVGAAVDALHAEERALKAEVDGLRQGLGDPRVLEEQLEAVEGTLHAMETALQAEQAARDQAEAARDAARAHYEAQAALREQYQSLQHQRTLCQNDLQHANRRLEELREQWEQFKTACERYRAIKPDAERYRQLARDLQAVELLAQAERQRAQLQAQHDSLAERDAQLRAEQDALQQKRVQLDALQPQRQQAESLRRELETLRQRARQAATRARLEAQLQALREQLQLLQAKAAEHEALAQAVQAAEADLQAHQAAYAQTETALQHALQGWNQQRAAIEAALRALETTLEQQRDRVAQLEALGEASECPTCGQPLGDAYHRVLTAAQQEVQATERQRRTLQGQLRTLQREPSEVRTLREQLAQQQQARDHAQQHLAQRRAYLQQLESELAQLGTLQRQQRELQRQLERVPLYDPQEEQRVQAALDALQPALQEAHALEVELRRLPTVQRERERIAHERQRLQTELARLPQGYDAERHTALRAETDRLRPLYEESLQLMPMLKRRESLLQQIEMAKTAQQQAADRLKQIEAQIAQLGYSESAYQEAERAYQHAEQQLNALERSLAARRAELESQTALRDQLRAQLEQLRTLQRTLQEKEHQLRMHSLLRKAMQEFRVDLNTRLRPTLAALATEFLNALTNGRYSELEIDEEYRFTLLDEGQRKQVISGGEEDIVNLSLRLALARLITERAGQPMSLLILDEVFASLDAERRHNVMELLNNLRTWFDQILVISHFEEINEAADRCLRVWRNPQTRASEITEDTLPDPALLTTAALEAELIE